MTQNAYSRADYAPHLLLALLYGQVGYYALHSLAYGLHNDKENATNDIHRSDGQWHDG